MPDSIRALWQCASLSTPDFLKMTLLRYIFVADHLPIKVHKELSAHAPRIVQPMVEHLHGLRRNFSAKMCGFFPPRRQLLCFLSLGLLIPENSWIKSQKNIIFQEVFFSEHIIFKDQWCYSVLSVFHFSLGQVYHVLFIYWSVGGVGLFLFGAVMNSNAGNVPAPILAWPCVFICFRSIRRRRSPGQSLEESGLLSKVAAFLHSLIVHVWASIPDTLSAVLLFTFLSLETQLDARCCLVMFRFAFPGWRMLWGICLGA